MDLCDENAANEIHTDIDPVIFLRCHSRTDKDYADIKTQVWQAVFKPKKNSPIIATCGGNKVCLINVATGEVEQRYCCSDVREIFYAVTWGKLKGINKNYIVLVAGGVRCTLHFIYPKAHAIFLEYKVSSSKKDYISNLLFHPNDSNTLFCSMNKDVVICYKISVDSTLEQTKVKKILTLSTGSEIITSAFCQKTSTLLTATDMGLQGWSIKNTENVLKQPQLLKFHIVQEQKTDSVYNNKLVDSVEEIGNGIVAAKWALNNYIYVWDMCSVKYSKKSVGEITPIYILKWRATDNYYMGIGGSHDAGVVACGDDKGCIWVYDISEVTKEIDVRFHNLEPIKVIEWPILRDRFAVKSRKLDLNVYDIVIAKTAIHSSGQYIVAVTNNNLVCIWKLSKIK